MTRLGFEPKLRTGKRTQYTIAAGLPFPGATVTLPRHISYS